MLLATREAFAFSSNFPPGPRELFPPLINNPRGIRAFSKPASFAGIDQDTKINFQKRKIYWKATFDERCG